MIPRIPRKLSKLKSSTPQIDETRLAIAGNLISGFRLPASWSRISEPHAFLWYSWGIDGLEACREIGRLQYLGDGLRHGECSGWNE